WASWSRRSGMTRLGRRRVPAPVQSLAWSWPPGWSCSSSGPCTGSRERRSGTTSMRTTSWRASNGEVTACIWGDLEEQAMARVRRKRNSNGDLVEAAEGCLPHILMFYDRFEDKRPVMLLDL